MYLKLRAWSKNSGMFLQTPDHYFVYNPRTSLWDIEVRRDGVLCGCYGGVVVMPFTGITDCHGVEVYEGDIFRAPHDFGPGGYEVREGTVFHDVVSGGYQWNYWLVDKLEVLGNIYEGKKS